MLAETKNNLTYLEDVDREKAEQLKYVSDYYRTFKDLYKEIGKPFIIQRQITNPYEDLPTRVTLAYVTVTPKVIFGLYLARQAIVGYFDEAGLGDFAREVVKKHDRPKRDS